MPLNTACQYAEFNGVSDVRKSTLESYALYLKPIEDILKTYFKSFKTVLFLLELCPNLLSFSDCVLFFNWRYRLLVNKSWFHIYFYCPLLNPEV